MDFLTAVFYAYILLVLYFCGKRIVREIVTMLEELDYPKGSGK